eukprot:1583803-Prymnesium_polylepis.2
MPRGHVPMPRGHVGSHAAWSPCHAHPCRASAMPRGAAEPIHHSPDGREGRDTHASGRHCSPPLGLRARASHPDQQRGAATQTLRLSLTPIPNPQSPIPHHTHSAARRPRTKTSSMRRTSRSVSTATSRTGTWSSAAARWT